PYAESPEFPILGTGGRTAMAGPVYYTDDYPKDTRYSKYYNKKLFIYDFMRDWIMAVTMDSSGNLQTIEPFMPNTKFYGLIDMETGSDGRIYILEYGKGWFTQNSKAALSVINYNAGNRSPVARIKVNKDNGSLPLSIHASAGDTEDPDGDKLHFEWFMNNNMLQETDTPGIDYSFKEPGMYSIKIRASDGKGGTSESKKIKIYAGNNRPKVNISLTSSNPIFFFPDRPISYKVSVSDQEDGNS